VLHVFLNDFDSGTFSNRENKRQLFVFRFGSVPGVLVVRSVGFHSKRNGTLKGSSFRNACGCGGGGIRITARRKLVKEDTLVVIFQSIGTIVGKGLTTDVLADFCVLRNDFLLIRIIDFEC
jgi:hypothetical protein